MGWLLRAASAATGCKCTVLPAIPGLVTSQGAFSMRVRRLGLVGAGSLLGLHQHVDKAGEPEEASGAAGPATRLHAAVAPGNGH